jgi:hypothetical protein
VYITRFVEHVAGQKIASIELLETPRAASFLIRLENGGLASAICNYLNPMGPSRCGWESLRVFGSKGAVESDPLRLIVTSQPPRELPVLLPAEDYFTLYVRSLRSVAQMPMTLEEELNPTRWVIRAKK